MLLPFSPFCLTTRVCLTFFLLTEKEKDAPQSEWWRMVQGLLAFIEPWAFVVGAVTWNWRVIPDADPLCKARHSCCDGSYSGHLKRRTCHVILRSWAGDQNIFSRSFLIWFIKADCSFFTSTPLTSCSNSRAHSLSAWSGSAVTRTATECPSCQLHDLHNQNPSESGQRWSFTRPPNGLRHRIHKCTATLQNISI